MYVHSRTILCVCYLAIVQCGNIRSYVTRSVQDASEVGNGSPGGTNPINLLSVERNPGEGNENTFTIRFTKNVQHLVFKIFNFELPGQESEHGEEQDDAAVSTYTFSCNRSENFKDVLFQVSSRDKTSTITLVLDNSGDDSKRQDTIRVPEYDVIPSGDLVYYPGRDINFVVALTSGVINTDGDNERLYPRLYAVDLSTRKFHIIHGNEGLIEENHVNGTTDTLVTIKTSERRVSGLLDLVYAAPGGLEDLVQEVLAIRSSVVLRPFTQTGPFPLGYVGFVERDPEYCPVNSDCPVSCVAVGDSLSSIRVKEMVSGGGLEEVPSATEPMDNNPYTRYLRWTVSGSEDNGPAGDVRLFQCLAMSVEYGAVAYTVIEVRVYLQGEIIEERSNYTLQNNTGTTSTDAVLSCAFRGRPLPNVTFSLEYEYTYLYNEAADEVISTGENEAVAVKHVTFDTDIGNDYFWDANGRLLGAVCLVEQLDANAFSHYNLPLVGNESP